MHEYGGIRDCCGKDVVVVDADSLYLLVYYSRSQLARAKIPRKFYRTICKFSNFKNYITIIYFELMVLQVTWTVVIKVC